MVLYFLRISSILLTCLLVAGSYARAQQATGSAGTTIKNDSTASGLGVIVMRTEISKNIPQVKGPVSDYGNVLTQEQIAEIDSLVRSIWAETKNEIYVSILDSSMTNTSDLPDFAEYMYFSWPYINRQRGVLIVLAPAIRRVRIVTGKELGPSQSDAVMAVYKDMYPELHENKFFEGLKTGIRSVMSRIYVSGL